MEHPSTLGGGMARETCGCPPPPVPHPLGCNLPLTKTRGKGWATSSLAHLPSTRNLQTHAP
eukprot:9443562-Pyramimonas_sp.AAC.1